MLGRHIDLGNPVADHPLNNGLVAWWLPLPNNQGGSRLFDLRGANPGTLVNGPTWAADPNGFGAVRCTGTTQRVVTAATSALFPSATTATVAVWHRKTDTTNRDSAGFGSDSTVSSARCGAHLPFTDGNVYWDWGGTTAGSTRVSAAVTSDTRWHLWAFTVGGGLGMRIYRDGVLLASNAATPSRTAGGNFVLNSGNSSVSPGPGDLAEFGAVWVYSRALSPGEVAALYDQGARGHPDTLRRWTRRAVLWVPAGAIPSGSGTCSGVADATGTGSAARSGSGSCSATGDLTGTGTVTRSGSGSVSGTADASGVGFAPSGTASGSGTCSGAGDLTGTGSTVRSGSGVCAGVADATGTGTTVRTGSGTCSGVGALAGAGPGEPVTGFPGVWAVPRTYGTWVEPDEPGEWSRPRATGTWGVYS